MTVKLFGLVILLSCLSPQPALARDKLAVLKVSRQSEISANNILLEDIADIDLQVNVSNEILQRLRAISLGNSPSPGEERLLKGEEVLAAISAAGFDAEQLGYSIPREFSVKRSGRVLGKQELIDATEESIRLQADRNGRRSEIRVRDVQLNQKQTIPGGITKLEVVQVGNSRRGRVPISFSVMQEGGIERTFPATAIVDEWMMLPVAGRDIERGAVVTRDDLNMVRLNLAEQASDITDQEKDIVGKKTKVKIALGSLFRPVNLEVLPLINKGKRVVLSYSIGALNATATGVAVEDGFRGMVVAVRNENSKRVVRGIAENESLVQVTDAVE